MKDDDEIIQTTLRIPRGLLRQLKVQAALHDQSMQEYILTVLTRTLPKGNKA